MKNFITMHKPIKSHLEKVKDEMRILGSPKVKVFIQGNEIFCLEGTHRIAAAHDLGFEVDIEEMSEDDQIEHDIQDLNSPCFVHEIMLHLDINQCELYKF